MARRDGPVVIPADGTAWCTRCGWEPPEDRPGWARRALAHDHATRAPASCTRVQAQDREAARLRHPANYGPSPFGDDDG